MPTTTCLAWSAIRVSWHRHKRNSPNGPSNLDPNYPGFPKGMSTSKLKLLLLQQPILLIETTFATRILSILKAKIKDLPFQITDASSPKPCQSNTLKRNLNIKMNLKWLELVLPRNQTLLLSQNNVKPQHPIITRFMSSTVCQISSKGEIEIQNIIALWLNGASKTMFATKAWSSTFIWETLQELVLICLKILSQPKAERAHQNILSQKMSEDFLNNNLK